MGWLSKLLLWKWNPKLSHSMHHPMELVKGRRGMRIEATVFLLAIRNANHGGMILKATLAIISRSNGDHKRRSHSLSLKRAIVLDGFSKQRNTFDISMSLTTWKSRLQQYIWKVMRLIYTHGSSVNMKFWSRMTSCRFFRRAISRLSSKI